MKVHSSICRMRIPQSTSPSSSSTSKLLTNVNFSVFRKCIADPEKSICLSANSLPTPALAFAITVKPQLETTNPPKNIQWQYFDLFTWRKMHCQNAHSGSLLKHLKAPRTIHPTQRNSRNLLEYTYSRTSQDLLVFLGPLNATSSAVSKFPVK